LIFQSETTLDPLTLQMMIRETFQFRGGGSSTVECYTTEIRMRCCSASELHERFAPWFENIDILHDYVVPPASTGSRDELAFGRLRPQQLSSKPTSEFRLGLQRCTATIADASPPA
jgi:hypothetical protein